MSYLLVINYRMPKKTTQKPEIKVKVKVKRSYAGLGLFADQEIKKNTWIIEYKGKIITNEQADVIGGKYLFEINSKKTINGTTRTNTARYVNHACRPNAEPVWHNKGMWIQAIKKIEMGEEITYNYGKDYFDAIIKPHGCRCNSKVKVHRGA